MQSLDKVRELVLSKYKDQHQNRLNHILGVVEMASYLSYMYNINKDRAMIAAYMHDYCKYDDYNDAKNVLSKEDIEECEEYPFLYHAYMSAEAYKNIIGDDEEIYQAIRNHVFGRPNMSVLEAIIMIADYTEKNRSYPSCIECRKILMDGNMDLAIYKSLKYTIEHNIKNNNKPHPRQLEVLKEYEEKIKL